MLNTRNLINRDDGNGGGVAVALKISAFARKYDLCEVSVRRLIRAGELRTIKVGHILRVLDDVALAGTSSASVESDGGGEAA